ncbi:MAG TPA: protein translocase subunit SecD [Planctomycetota bacterium]
MLENVGRKVALIVVLLLVSIGLMILPEQPFRLGLDLQGGTRITYRFDFDAARERGEIGEGEDESEILEQAKSIIRQRVDPTGTRDAIVRTEGEDKIVIELPGKTAVEGTAEAETTLGQALDLTTKTSLVLTDATGFSSSGVIQVGAEQIRYARRDGNTLHDLTRAHDGKQETHAAGQAVRLVNSDAIRDAIENLGDLAFVLVAEAQDFTGSGTDLGGEQNKLTAWQGENPGAPIVAFNLVPPAEGGPDPSIRWYPTRFADDQGEPIYGPPTAIRTPRTAAETIRGQDLQRIYYTTDQYGYPAVGFEIRSERIDDFADFTGDNLNRRMAIILNDEVRSAPTLNSKLVGGGIIEGRFKPEEVKSLVTVLRSGSLKLKPTLENDERIGATLGDDYVQRGLYSSVLALVIVVAFMMIYYRRLGVFSALALLTNLVMFMGGLAFLQATLTLPGIAGIILTVGMAVDANILIFDRLREEAEKGRNPKQAAKAGFDNAMSAIIDANVTTFLTAIVLYKLGTGPVRGFAVTLMIGILTSVFAALVTTRVFVHWALSRGSQTFKMGRWMADANFDFLGKTRTAVTGSIILCLGGLMAFWALPDHEKLGIDFTGGVEAMIETAKPETIDTLRTRVAQIPGIGDSAEVKTVLNTGQGDGTFTKFRLQFKTLAGSSEVDLGKEMRPILQAALKDLLLESPVQVALSDVGEDSRADVQLYFKDPPEEGALRSALEQVGLRDVTVSAGSRADAFNVSALTTSGRDHVELERSLGDALSRVPDVTFAAPIPSFSQVGPQVVGELRDKALLALAVSLFITVMYIRVRFAEYSYGIAAIVALVHDVLVTLAALSIGNHFGIVNGELNLAMIAVFLTIIGYSVNDTIVIFDRVRENLPKSDKPLREVLNTSVNETLSRTIMTSLTVFLAIVVQYAFNVGTGNVLESISFAMIFGTLSGVYSTVYIANPVFLWLETRSQKQKTDGGAQARARRDEERKRDEARRKAKEAEEGAEVQSEGV